MKVTVTHNIDDERIADLLCCAFEGGSNYWIENVWREMAPGAEAEFLSDVPIVEGCKVFIKVDEEDDVEPYVLDRTSLQSGLEIMAEKYDWHMANFLTENEDAETGDVFLQCCLFGEIVYG